MSTDARPLRRLIFYYQSIRGLVLDYDDAPSRLLELSNIRQELNSFEHKKALLTHVNYLIVICLTFFKQQIAKASFPVVLQFINSCLAELEDTLDDWIQLAACDSPPQCYEVLDDMTREIERLQSNHLSGGEFKKVFYKHMIVVARGAHKIFAEQYQTEE